MNNYMIFTDSACDLSRELLNERNVPYASLSFRFNGEDKEYFSSDMSIKDFYNRMRQGEVAKTAAANSVDFTQIFENALASGEDVLYLGFSSALSTTFNSARIACEELKNKYPDRKFFVVDTLCASAGQALLMDLVIKKRNSGATIEEAAQYAEDLKLKICHWFTVDDLEYLKRGGRVSSSAAFFGNMLGIKPILHVDNNGKLINVGKIRGRRASVEALTEKYSQLKDEKAEKIVYISHADCIADAEYLAKVINEKYGAKTELITDVGSVIGAHAGPGTLALFFVGTER